MKQCIFCGEEIQDSAIKCRFCGEFLNGKNKESIEVTSTQEIPNAHQGDQLQNLYVVPVWKFMLYNTLSFGLYHLGYLGMVRTALQKQKKIPLYTGIKSFLGFNRGFSIKLVQGVNECLKDRSINKKISVTLITILYWVFLILLLLSIREISNSGVIILVYIFAFFLSVSMTSFVHANNKYLASKKPSNMKGIIGEVILVSLGILVMIGSFYGLKDNSVNNLLIESSIEINRTLPKTVDSETRLDNTKVLPNNTLQYELTLLNVDKNNVNIEEMKEQHEKSLLDSMKNNEQMKLFFDKKISVAYSYKDKNGEHLYDVNITPEKINNVN